MLNKYSMAIVLLGILGLLIFESYCRSSVEVENEIRMSVIEQKQVWLDKQLLIIRKDINGKTKRIR